MFGRWPLPSAATAEKTPPQLAALDGDNPAALFSVSEGGRDAAS